MGEKKKRDDDKCRVKVHIRLKKCVDKEGATYNIFADGTQLHIPNNEGRLELDRWYRFDHIYSAIASNKEVYRLSTYDLVESALKGINSSIFAYGQTGSGKTHTLMSKDGVTAHMISHLFNRIWKSTDDYKVTCSYFQIYNEHIYDLLNPQNSSECVVREDADRDVYVENVTNVLCETPMDVYELINIGRKSLILAEMKMNRLSCKSHAVCQLAIEKRKGIPRTKKRSMHETYSTPDILIEKPPGEDNKTPIDFATVPFNKADIRKRHSIAVTKVNDSKKSPRVPRSPSVSNTRNSPNGSVRDRSNSLRFNDKRNRQNGSSPSEHNSLSDHLATINSPGRSRSGKLSNGNRAEISKEKPITMTDAIGVENIKRLHDLYQSNIVSSDADNEIINFGSENSFTLEGCADDYDSYYHEVGNGNEIDDSPFVDGNGTNGSSAESLTVRKSKISIIDLAGSERLTETNVDSERLKEAQNINLSLLELGNVISALASGKKKHIPYRNSVLTRLLQDSLGGNCKTKFLLCVSTKTIDINETKCTLDFGQKLTKVFTKPILNLDIDYKRKYEQLLEQLKEKENNHETIKSEFSDRISITKEKIEEQESVRCGHEAMLNELQTKVDNAGTTHEESKKEINTLRDKLVEQETIMKSKDEEISRLKTEFEQLLGKLESKTMTNEKSTLDATTNTSLPDLTLDFSDGSTVVSPVPNRNAENDADLTSSMECHAGSNEFLCDDVIETSSNSTREESNNAMMEGIAKGTIDDTDILKASKGVASPIDNSITNEDTSTNVVCRNHTLGRDIDVCTDVCTDANYKEKSIQVTDLEVCSNIDMCDVKMSVQSIETTVSTTTMTDQGSSESVKNSVGVNPSEKESDNAMNLLDSTLKLNPVPFTKPANETDVNHSAHPCENTSYIGLRNDEQNSKLGISDVPTLIIDNKIPAIDTVSDVNRNITISTELPLPMESMTEETNALQSSETSFTLENPGVLSHKSNGYDEKYIINDYPIQTSTPGQNLSPRNEPHSEIDAQSSSLDYPHSSSQDSFAFTDVSEDFVIELADSSTNTDDDYVIDLYSPTPVETCEIATNTSDDELPTVVLITNNASTNTNDSTTVTNPIVVTFVQPPKTEVVFKKSPGINVGSATCDASTSTGYIWPVYELDENSDDNDLKASLQMDLSTHYETINTVRAAIMVELSKLRHLYDLTKDSRYYLQNEFEMIGSIEGSNSTLTDDPEPDISDGIYTVIHEIFALLPNILSESQYSLNNSTFSQEVIKTPEKTTKTTKPSLNSAPIALKYAPAENQFEFLQEFLKERKDLLEREMLYIVTEMSNQNGNNDSNDHHRVEDTVSHVQLIEKLLYHVARGRSPQFENIEKLQNLLDMVLCNHTVTSCLIALSRWPRLTKGQDITSDSTAESEKHRYNLQNLSYQMAIETSPKHSVNDEDNANRTIDEHVKRRKGFLNRFLCMPSKSSKVKKSK